MCRNGRTRGNYLHFYSGSAHTVVIIGCKSWLKHDHHTNAISKDASIDGEERCQSCEKGVR